MKKKAIFYFILIASIMLISSCGRERIAPERTPEPEAAAILPGAEAPADESEEVNSEDVINVLSFDNEVTDIINRYVGMHPDLRYKINSQVRYPLDINYEPNLDEALAEGGSGAPDIYFVDSSFVTKYTQGEMSGYAMPYEELGIDVNAEADAADIAWYIVDIGTRPSDGAVVGLSYQSTPGAFLYRRSIAKEVWDTDDPAVIASKIGPGWDRFFEAAEKLKSKGCAIVPSCDDIWWGMANSADKCWIVDGKLYIDPKREAFIDYSTRLNDKGYSDNDYIYSMGWYDDIAGEGDKPVFGFMMPAWMICEVMDKFSRIKIGGEGGAIPVDGTYGDWAVCVPPVNFFWRGSWILANKELAGDPDKKAAVAGLLDWMTLQCGEDSLQYYLANGTLLSPGGAKNTVASRKVMSEANGALGVLGGQNMFDVYVPASQDINGKNVTQYDCYIEGIMWGEIRQLLLGYTTREGMVEGFKIRVKEQLGFDAWSQS